MNEEAVRELRMELATERQRVADQRAESRAILAALNALHTARGTEVFAGVLHAIAPVVPFERAWVQQVSEEAELPLCVVPEGAEGHAAVGQRLAALCRGPVTSVFDLDRIERGWAAALGARSALNAVVETRDGQVQLVLLHSERGFFTRAHEHLLARLLPLLGQAQRHRAQQQLVEEREAAFAADRAKSDFLATISHEIRTPMNAVIGMTELLLGTSLDSEQRSYAKSIEQNSEALLTLIDDVLDLTKIEAGAMELVIRPFSIVELVEGVVQTYAAQARDGVLLYADIAPDVPAQVSGDGARLRQILTNLVSNAVKYTDEGEVVVRVSVETQSWGRSTLRFSVVDTGLGIAVDDQERIFSKYRQSSQGSRRGTGLGLHITQSLCELMGASLGVTSEVGRGSCFELQVDFDVIERQSGSWAEVCGKCSGLRIEVISAKSSVQRAVRSALNGVAAEISYAESWLGAPGQREPDVFVVDTSVPELERRRLLECRVPVVLLRPLGRSMASGDREAHSALALPFRRRELALALLAAKVADTGLPVALTESGAEDSVVVGQPLRVLVVEDNPDNRAVAKGLLERAGHLVQVAEDGLSGLAAMRQGGWDVVLMDLHMPGMDGVETTRRIRALQTAAGQGLTPIVAYTAHATEEVRDQALQAGCLEFLAKPARPQELLAALRRVTRPRAQILVVDDAKDSRRLLHHHLTREGFAVPLLDSGVRAVEYLERHPVDLVLLDVEMPEMSGLDAVRALRARGLEVPIIATTGHTDATMHAELRLAGFDDVLEKPVRSRSLMRMVQRWVFARSSASVDLEAIVARSSAAVPTARVPADLEPLIPAFLDDRRTDVRTLRAALEAEDWSVVRRVGHSMKGTGSAYGFDRISAMGRDIELAASGRDAGQVAQLVEGLDRYLGRVVIQYC